MTSTPRRVRVGTCPFCFTRFTFTRNLPTGPDDPPMRVQICPACYRCIDQSTITSTLERPEDAPYPRAS